MDFDDAIDGISYLACAGPLSTRAPRRRQSLNLVQNSPKRGRH